MLLVFSIGGTSFGDALNSEVVAAEVVAMIVGSIGLIATVPITTALAALVAERSHGTSSAPRPAVTATSAARGR